MATNPVSPRAAADDESWDEIKQRLQKRWGQIDDSDLSTPMSMQQLSEMIQSKTGEAREQVESFLEDLRSSMLAKAEGIRRTVAPHLADIQDRASARLGDANRSFREGVSMAEEQVRSKPAQSLGIAFGIGILAGVLLGAGRRT